MKLPEIIDTPDEDVSAGYGKRFIILIASLLAIGGVVVGLFLWLTAPDEDANPDRVQADIELSQEEQDRVKNDLDGFLREAGTFGLSPDKVNGTNIIDVKNILLTQDANQSMFYETRDSSYYYIRDTYIHSSSPLFIPNRTVDSWDTSFENNALINYELASATIDVPANGYMSVVGDQEMLTVQADVSFSSKVTKRAMTVTDSSSNGAFSVFERGFSDNTATVTVVKTPEGPWKIYSISELEYPLLLSTWATPTESAWNLYQDDFNIVDTIETEIAPTEDGFDR